MLDDREKLKSANILILSPNSVFSDYISHVLPELGEEHIREMSFDLFAYRELKDIVKDCEDRYHYIERRMKAIDISKERERQWKQSDEFIGAVESFLVLLEDDLMNFKRFEYRGFTKTAEELVQLFYFKFSEHPLLARMEAVMEYVLDEYETLSGRTLVEEELIWIREWFMGMYETMDVYEIYNWILEDNGFEPLLDAQREERVLAYEDVYPMLYLKQRLYATKKRKDIRHLIIDEMQDYSYLQYVILQNMFSCNMTILGDKAQTVDEKPQDVLEFLPKIFGKQIRQIEMNRSYRNTIEIAEYAEKLGALNNVQYLERHGKPVEERVCNSEKEALKDIMEKIQLGPETYETAAILTMTESQAKAVYKQLKQQRKDVYYIDRDSSSFRKGVTVTTFYLAKGLEFDQVFILGGDRENTFFSQYRYISATRALHELYVYDI